MQSVMNQCKFVDGEYAPSSDSEVNDIRVDAERPTLPAGAGASLASDSPPFPGGNLGIYWALVVGVAGAIAFLV